VPLQVARYSTSLRFVPLVQSPQRRSSADQPLPPVSPASIRAHVVFVVPSGQKWIADPSAHDHFFFLTTISLETISIVSGSDSHIMRSGQKPTRRPVVLQF